MGQPLKAVECYEKHLRGRVAAEGDDFQVDTDSAEALLFLATQYVNAQRTTEAEQCCSRLL